jgi:branched-chain amino acid transport system substrate-binding protein
MDFSIRSTLLPSVVLALALAGTPTLAQTRYDPGVSDDEIKIGETMPYSGPVSSNGTIGKAHAAYFAKINAEGGINGRQIRFITLDDAYSPPKAFEQTRKLVEQEGVFLIFGSLGTAVNSATQKYLNAKQVPQLLITTAGLKWNDPQHFPWTMAMPPSQRVDATLYAKHLLAKHPRAKIALLYQNDDFGKDYVKALREGLGAAREWWSPRQPTR